MTHTDIPYNKDSALHEKKLIQHKTTLFKEHLKYVIAPLKSISRHGYLEDNLYSSPLFCFFPIRVN